jgi:DNA polymerase
MIDNDLETINNCIKNCSLCKLRNENERLRNLIDDQINEKYGLPVPGVGTKTAKMMIFGEAPGADEVVQGKPFVGKAGTLLRECLQDIGIDPKLIYIANVINCRPPVNKFPQGTDIDDIVKVCIKWARKQIAIIKPKIIVGLGSQPLKYIYQSSDKLSSVYGKVFEWNIKAINHSTLYMPTLHPSFCIRPGRNYSPIPNDELSDGQLMMSLSITEKKDILRNNLNTAYKYIKE